MHIECLEFATLLVAAVPIETGIPQRASAYMLASLYLNLYESQVQKV